MDNLLTPRDAAAKMGISQATITRCVKRGAPVHRWGSTGYRYRINVSEFVRWMESQGVTEKPKAIETLTMEEMARRRRAAFRAV